MPLELARLLGALLVLLPTASFPSPAPARAACVVPAEMPFIGIALASVDARGQWVGRWLGAHPLSCDGATYVADVNAASWADLQRALAATGPERFLIGDVPYIGDDTCIPSTLRRWWGPGPPPTAEAVTWEPGGVPPGAPAFTCPQNTPAEAPLVLRPAAP
jgi:hypothetical protein